MNMRWFKIICKGWCEWPVSWQGWLITGIWIATNIWYFLRVDAMSHSASDTLIAFAPFFAVSSIALSIIARFTSK